MGDTKCDRASVANALLPLIKLVLKWPHVIKPVSPEGHSQIASSPMVPHGHSVRLVHEASPAFSEF